MPQTTLLRFFVAFLTAFTFSMPSAQAEFIAVTEFFTGRVELFDAQTKSESTLATIAGNPGLAGIAYNAANNRLYVSALNHGGVYMLNAQTGMTLGFQTLGGGGPGGLAVGSNGNVYVSDFTSNNVRVFDANLTSLNSISVPQGNVTSGVGFAANGDLLITTAGAGVFKFDGSTVSTFNGLQLASAQIAVDASSNVFVGHGLGFSDSVFKFNSSGGLLGTFDVTDAMVNGTGTGSSTGTGPSGVAFNANGNYLMVAALGRSNPSDPGGERGGLFKFDTNGNLLDTFAAGSKAFSSVAIISAVPEPSSTALVALSGILTFAARRRVRSASRFTEMA